MWLVEYSYYDDHAVNSVWYSLAKAEERARELNKRDRCLTKPRWRAVQIPVGDDLE